MSRDRLAAFERQLTRWWRQVSRSLGPASSARTVLDVAVAPLLHLLGHDRPVLTPHPLGLCGSVSGSDVSLMTLPWSTPVRTAWRDAATRGLAGHSSWAMVSNGRSLRIVDCTRTWTRLGLEFDFEMLTASPKGVVALWWLANAEAMRTAGAGSLRASVASSDAHAARVCNSLGDGVLEALPRLASALTPGASTRHAAATFDQALTVVYRILFLLFAEARGAVPIWHELYRDAYTIEALTRQAGKAHARGLWAALQAISRLAHAGCKAADLEVTAFNGRLFSPRHAPLVEQRRVPDAVVRDVLLSLATESTPQGLRRISYHDLGVEQLGSVYERVLEYEPRSRGVSIALSRTSIERKATGSFYTPRSITEFLVRRTLVAAGRRQDRPIRSSSCACSIPPWAAARFSWRPASSSPIDCEKALIEEGRWSPGDVRPSDRAALKRQVAERCLYGVDLNPTAVQLARLSMWLTTLAADRPLTFLDHHLAAGNSLLGASITDLSQPPTPARRVRTTTSLPLLRRSARRDRRASSDAGPAPARAHAVGFPRGRERQGTNVGGALGGGRPDRQVVARGGPLVRRAAMARGFSRGSAHRRPRVSLPNGWPPQPDRRPRCRRRNFASRCAPRARSRRATAPFTGSWRFRKCSSTVTGGSNPTAALMPCSATRRGTWCAPTPALRRIAPRPRPARTAALRFYRASRGLFAAGQRARQPLSIVPGARVAADETGRTRRADPAFRALPPIMAARRCANICSIAPRSTPGSASTIAGASFRFTAV